MIFALMMFISNTAFSTETRVENGGCEEDDNFCLKNNCLSPQQISSVEDAAIYGDEAAIKKLLLHYPSCRPNSEGSNMFRYWLQIAAENGDKHYQDYLADWIERHPEEYGVPIKYLANIKRWNYLIRYWQSKSQKKPADTLENKALAGDGPAAVRLYEINEFKYPEPDIKEALNWLQIAALNGDPEAWRNLLQSMKDPEKRVKWFGVAADDKKMNELFDKRIKYWEKKLAQHEQQEEKERLESLKKENAGK